MPACGVIEMILRTLKRYFKAFVDDETPTISGKVLVAWSHRLSQQQNERILLTCNQAQCAALPPGQIALVLGGQGLYIRSETRFDRMTDFHSRVIRRGRARLVKEPRAVPRLRAAGASKV